MTLKTTLKTKIMTTIKKWYLKTYPTDDLGQEIKETITFNDVLNALQNQKDIYSLIDVHDSLIRERIFEKLAEIEKKSYNEIYSLWLSETTHVYKNILQLHKTKIMNKPRPIYKIAEDISKDWGYNVNYSAKPYLEAMFTLCNIDDYYYYDTADKVVRYFLANARTWRGDTAKTIKNELKSMLK